ncbi:MAG: adenylate/guanylate cyclase domain-containing protein [Gilvibacter sp.]
MKNSNEDYSKRQRYFYFRRALWVFLAWVGISNILFFYEYYTLSSNNVYNSSYDFLSNFIANLIIAVTAGIIGGTITINLMEKALRRYAFIKALFLIFILYTITAVLISAIGVLYIKSEDLNLPMFHSEVIEELLFFFGSWMFIKNYVVWLFIVIVTLIILMVNEKYGPGVFPDYLMGKYFIPTKERRIFMFADIKNATGIAEELGEKRYFNFLKDFFKDIAPAIVHTHGEVYQYVGDEVVISWKMKKGLKKANAIRCFYIMNQLLDKRKALYLKRYGVAPEFKAGLHCGSVMSGEIGQIKREIAFSGDVLNTTARIQAECNRLEVSILASRKLANLMVSLPKTIEVVAIGAHPLKGKSEAVDLVTFRYNH